MATTRGGEGPPLPPKEQFKESDFGAIGRERITRYFSSIEPWFSDPGREAGRAAEKEKYEEALRALETLAQARSHERYNKIAELEHEGKLIGQYALMLREALKQSYDSEHTFSNYFEHVIYSRAVEAKASHDAETDPIRKEALDRTVRWWRDLAKVKAPGDLIPLGEQIPQLNITFSNEEAEALKADWRRLGETVPIPLTAGMRVEAGPGVEAARTEYIKAKLDFEKWNVEGSEVPEEVRTNYNTAREAYYKAAIEARKELFEKVREERLGKFNEKQRRERRAESHELPPSELEEVRVEAVKEYFNEVERFIDQEARLSLEESGRGRKLFGAVKRNVLRFDRYYRSLSWKTKLALGGIALGSGVGALIIGRRIIAGVSMGIGSGMFVETALKERKRSRREKVLVRETADNVNAFLDADNRNLDQQLESEISRFKKRGVRYGAAILTAATVGLGVAMGAGKILEVTGITEAPEKPGVKDFKGAVEEHMDWLWKNIDTLKQTGGSIKESVETKAERYLFGSTPSGMPPPPEDVPAKVKPGTAIYPEGPKGGAARPGDVVSAKPSLAEKAPKVETLIIGKKGPEGALIKYLTEHQDTAEKLGWKEGTDIKEWAGKKAHRLWLAHAKEMLEKPETLAQLKKLGYSEDLEGYGQMMRRIGKGFVEFDPSGKMRLVDTEYLKARVIAPDDVAGAGKESVRWIGAEREAGGGVSEEDIKPHPADTFGKGTISAEVEPPAGGSTSKPSISAEAEAGGRAAPSLEKTGAGFELKEEEFAVVPEPGKVTPSASEAAAEAAREANLTKILADLGFNTAEIGVLGKIPASDYLKDYVDNTGRFMDRDAIRANLPGLSQADFEKRYQLAQMLQNAIAQRPGLGRGTISDVLKSIRA